MSATAAQLEALVRATFDAWNANDWEGIESLIEPDAVVIAPEEWPESGDVVGRPAIRRQFERLKEPLSEEHVEFVAIETEGSRALVEVVWAGTGEGSGLEMRIPLWMIYTIPGPRWSRIEYFIDEGKARTAWKAGLADEA